MNGRDMKKTKCYALGCLFRSGRGNCAFTVLEASKFYDKFKVTTCDKGLEDIELGKFLKEVRLNVYKKEVQNAK